MDIAFVKAILLFFELVNPHSVTSGFISAFEHKISHLFAGIVSKVESHVLCI